MKQVTHTEHYYRTHKIGCVMSIAASAKPGRR